MTTTCPGCGLNLPDQAATIETRLNASPACWKLYGELAAYTMALQDAAFLHQHAVDAYEAQHAGRGSNIGVAFPLIGLHLAIERKFTGRNVQRVHMVLAQMRKAWPAFEPPGGRAAVTIRDVLDAEPGDARNAMVIHWCRAVWDAWRHAHQWTRRTCDELLTESFSRRVRSR